MSKNNKIKIKTAKKYSYGDKNTDNLIIKGNNNEILDILDEHYHEQVSCIYIDPPYNNGENYFHYSDDKEHKVWLKEISNTLKKLKPLLKEEGSLWISIDDNEVHYLKVEADKIFGRKNFITTIIWQQRTTRENRKVFSNNHEYILVYARNPKKFKKYRNLLPPNETILSRYKNPDNDTRGPWQSISANVQAGHATKHQFYEIISPSGKKHNPPNGRCWVYTKEKMKQKIEQNEIWFGKDGNGVPRIKKFLKDANIGVNPQTLWMGNDVGTNEIAKKHLLNLFPNNPVFDTPKPEKLIKRIMEIATKEGDIVLDSYLGSGTTAAVAHKLNRKYIGIELSEQNVDYIVSRMNKVIQGEKGGISAETKWKGGGGFDSYL